MCIRDRGGAARERAGRRGRRPHRGASGRSRHPGAPVRRVSAAGAHPSARRIPARAQALDLRGLAGGAGGRLPLPRKSGLPDLRAY